MKVLIKYDKLYDFANSHKISCDELYKLITEVVVIDHDYLYDNIKDFESCAGHELNTAFTVGWHMARSTKSMFAKESVK